MIEVQVGLLQQALSWWIPILITFYHSIWFIVLFYCLCQEYFLGVPFRFPIHRPHICGYFNRASLVARLLGANLVSHVLWVWFVAVPDAPMASLKGSLQILLVSIFPVSCWSYANSWYLTLPSVRLFSSCRVSISVELRSFSFPRELPFRSFFFPLFYERGV